MYDVFDATRVTKNNGEKTIGRKYFQSEFQPENLNHRNASSPVWSHLLLYVLAASERAIYRLMVDRLNAASLPTTVI